MRGHHGDRRRHFHPGLFLLGALWLAAPEHASGQPLWLERVQSPDGVRDNSLTMKNILPELRAERGWTQGELATKLKVSRQTVNAIETERYEPSLSLAFTIAKLFERSIESI